MERCNEQEREASDNQGSCAYLCSMNDIFTADSPQKWIIIYISHNLLCAFFVCEVSMETDLLLNLWAVLGEKHIWTHMCLTSLCNEWKLYSNMKKIYSDKGKKKSKLTRICINIYHQSSSETTYLKKEIHSNIYKQAAK